MTFLIYVSSLTATQENIRGCKVKGIGGLGVWGGWGVEGFRSLGFLVGAQEFGI